VNSGVDDYTVELFRENGDTLDVVVCHADDLRPAG
jgi:hypothetical protein